MLKENYLKHTWTKQKGKRRKSPIRFVCLFVFVFAWDVSRPCPGRIWAISDYFKKRKKELCLGHTCNSVRGISRVENTYNTNTAIFYVCASQVLNHCFLLVNYWGLLGVCEKTKTQNNRPNHAKISVRFRCDSVSVSHFLKPKNPISVVGMHAPNRPKLNQNNYSGL